MSQFFTVAASSPGVVFSVTGANGVSVSPTVGNVVVSGINATTTTVGVASFNPSEFTVNGSGQVSLVGPSAPAIQTINTVSPNVSGNFTFSSADNTLTFTNTTNGVSVTLSDVANGYVNVTHAMSPYTVGATDYFISCDPTAGVITILLPNSPGPRREFIVKDRTGQAQTNNVTITTPGGIDTIDGLTSYIFTDNYESLEMLFNGLSYETF